MPDRQPWKQGVIRLMISNLDTEAKKLQFTEKSAETNRLICRIAGIFAIGTQLLYMIRILWNGSGFPEDWMTRAFSWFYLAGGILILALDTFHSLSLKGRNRLYMIIGSLCLFCNTFYNIYQLNRTGSGGYFTALTAVFFLTGLLMLPPAFTLVNLGIGYGLFAANLAILSHPGALLNYSVLVSLCLVIYLSRYRHICAEIDQAQKLRDVQRELSKVKREFSLSQDQYELIQEQQNSITFQWDSSTDRIRFSKEWKQYFNEPDDIQNFRDYVLAMGLITQECKNLILNCMSNVKSGVPFQRYELMLPRKNGVNAWFELRVIAQQGAPGQPPLGIGTLTDITDLKEKISELEEKSQLDQFTGLLNKASIERQGAAELAQLEPGEVLAALILDMDDFKQINDSLGHPAGDHVLLEVARLMDTYAPKGAAIGRIGGDEFMILYRTRDIQPFRAFAQDLINQVLKIQWKGKAVLAGCSIGIAVAASPEESFSSIYQKADAALYQAKHLGKGQVYCDC